MQASALSLDLGSTYPLGAHWDGQGVNFALVAPNAHDVWLCLFDESGQTEHARLKMPVCEDGVWHGYLPGAAPGLVYAYRLSGVYAPHQGHRFNPNKVLLDPYARSVVGQYLGQGAFLDNTPEDTAAIALKGRVVHETYDWGEDAPPQVPLSETIIYELHVKGFTQLNALVPETLRGTYAGLGQPVVLEYLKYLGVTTVDLLPVHAFVDESRLQKNGLTNYWGYNSIGFFAPDARYWSGRADTTPISEFRDMVKALHNQGIEVILDVIYNHTAEADETGPTLSFRGIDNSLYYHLHPDNPKHYENWSGCGNSLKLSEPRVLQMVMDSLRYWVEEMHVDGFRFDLAAILARDADGFSTAAPFFAAVQQDPALARVKLIAESWDLGAGGYQVGQFPAGWFEWNDQYRDTMRAFWLHQWPTLGDFAKRFAGSSDLFRHHNRSAVASVNFITAHDGFTLQDLVSHNHKHNQANGENNQDGSHHNHSWNCGVEGDTDDPDICQLRDKLRRALLATLLFSQGTPMLAAGDEMGRTQQGNNNVYCQDNVISWLDWDRADAELQAYVRQLILLRQRYPALRRVSWFTGKKQATGYADIVWLASSGGSIKDVDWHEHGRVCMGVLISGSETEATCLVLVNASAQPVAFQLPHGQWRVLLDSAYPSVMHPRFEGEVSLPAQSLWLAIPAKRET